MTVPFRPEAGGQIWCFVFGGAARQPANHKKGFYVTRVFIARYSQMRGCRKRPGGGGGRGDPHPVV